MLTIVVTSSYLLWNSNEDEDYEQWSEEYTSESLHRSDFDPDEPDDNPVSWLASMIEDHGCSEASSSPLSRKGASKASFSGEYVTDDYRTGRQHYFSVRGYGFTDSEVYEAAKMAGVRTS